MHRTLKTALLVAVLCLAAGSASASNEPCPDGWNVWVFHHGQTPYTYNCYSPNANLTPALAFAENQCQEAWDDVDHLVTHNGGFQVNMNDGLVPATWPPTYRWYYSCYTCIQGFPPAWADHVLEKAPVGLTEAVGIAHRLVPGVVVDATLQEVGEGNAVQSLYYVDIVEDDVMVQVTVDARTGEANVQENIEPATCSVR